MGAATSGPARCTPGWTPALAVAVMACAITVAGCTTEVRGARVSGGPTTVTSAKHLPGGWPAVLALAPDDEITFVVDNSRNGEVHQVVHARVDGIGQQVFGAYADALESDGYHVTTDYISHDADNLNWGLHAQKGPARVTVRVSGDEDGAVTVRFTHDVGTGSDD